MRPAVRRLERSCGWPQRRRGVRRVVRATGTRKPRAMRFPALALAALAVLCCVSPAVAAERGSPVGAKPIARLSASQAAKTLRASGLPAGRVRRGITAYRLRYVTVGVDGAPTTASTLLVLPHGRGRLPTVAYEHGTLVRRADAPSQGLDSLASSAAVLYGAAGFATVAPDYLGLGSGPGRQAYLHAASEAGASIDALRAAETFARRRGRRPDTRVLVTGFSQGGHAAMALGQALQRRAAPRLRLRALAPISGVFDLQRAEVPAILDGRMDGRLSAYNVSALLTSWQPIYHLYGSLDDVIAPDYAERLRPLFDGRPSDPQLLQAMPTRVSALLTLDGLDALRPRAGGCLRACAPATAPADGSRAHPSACTPQAATGR